MSSRDEFDYGCDSYKFIARPRSRTLAISSPRRYVCALRLAAYRVWSFFLCATLFELDGIHMMKVQWETFSGTAVLLRPTQCDHLKSENIESLKDK